MNILLVLILSTTIPNQERSPENLRRYISPPIIKGCLWCGLRDHVEELKQNNQQGLTLDINLKLTSEDELEENIYNTSNFKDIELLVDYE